MQQCIADEVEDQVMASTDQCSSRKWKGTGTPRGLGLGRGYPPPSERGVWGGGRAPPQKCFWLSDIDAF